MKEVALNRIDQAIDRDNYVRLFNLHSKYKWLENEQKAVFDLWCLAENDSQKSLLEILIKNFTHIDSFELNKIGKELSEQIEVIWNLKAQNTFLIATCGDTKPDGSQVLIQSMKNKFSREWQEVNFYNKITEGAHNVTNNSNVILVDDFIGTGNTIISKHKYLLKVLKDRYISNVTIKIITIAAMEFSKKSLNTLNVDYYSSKWLKKGISEQIPEPSKSDSILAMEQFENKLLDSYNNQKLPCFGYKRSESLYSLESYNVPNNVFPIFWWPYFKDREERNTIFKRI